jgi:hypothetical protein
LLRRSIDLLFFLQRSSGSYSSSTLLSAHRFISSFFGDMNDAKKVSFHKWFNKKLTILPKFKKWQRKKPKC